MEYLIIIAALLAGVLIGYLYASRKTREFESQLQMRDFEQKTTREQFQLLAAEKERSFQTQLEEKERSFQMQLEEKEKAHKTTIEAMQLRFDETIAKVTAQMQTATDEMLRQRQKEFTESSNISIGQIVNPLRETIDKMKQAMNDSTLRQTAMSSEMKANIENLMQQTQATKKSADELARVFTHGSKVQGDWGETVLDELLQSQGLTKGIHYDTQATLRDAAGNVVRSNEGNMMRPDVILHLDTRRELIIDSKVSLTAFMDYVNAEDEATRRNALHAHVDSIQKHVRELAQKNYSAYVQPPKVRMDYVIMFVPHSGALWAAMTAQPDLWRRAMERNVFIADEQTLFAALRIVNLTWTQITQAENHERVFQLANEMLDRVGQFMKKYNALGTALHKAQEAFDDGTRKLQPQGQSILQTAGKLIKLGAQQSERNPIPQITEQEITDTP